MDASTSKSLALKIAGWFEEAEILLDAALARAEARDLPRAAARAGNPLGVIYESVDRYSETLASTERALVHASRAGDHAWDLGGSASAMSARSC